MRKLDKFYLGILFTAALVMCSLLLQNHAGASTFGVIVGTVTEEKTREPLPGANVILEGTTIGAAADINGNYLIGNVPPGIYRLRASIIGYLPTVISGVKVAANETTHVHFKLAATAVEVPEVVVTATKKAQSFMETPASISVVSPRQIQQYNPVTLDEVLEFTPGVNMMGGQINIRGSSGFSRGAGSRVLLLVDGVPMLPGDSGDIKWDALPPNEIDHVEIVKGASSALYGSYAMGGVINVITKDPSEVPETTIRASGGVYDDPHFELDRWADRTLTYNNQNIAHARSLGKLKIRGSLGRSESSGYSQNGNYHRFNGYLKTKYYFSPTSFLTANVNYAQDKHGEFIAWRDASHRLEVPPESVGAETFSSKLQMASTYRALLNQHTTLKIRGSYYRNGFDNDLADPNNPFCNTSGTRIDAVSRKGELESQLDFEFAKGHATTVGVAGDFNFIDATLYGKHDGWDFGSYVQHEWKPSSQFSSVASLRFDYHWVDTGLIEYHLNPRVGLVYSPNPRLSFRTSAGRGFRAATMAEMFTCTKAAGFTVIPNPNLSSEIAWSYEVGAQFITPLFLVNSALFWNEYDDLIEGDFVIKKGIQVIQFLNFNRARIRGAELELNGALWKNILNFGASYTYLEARELARLDSTGVISETDAPLAYRPKHLLAGNLTLTLGRYNLGFDARYVSRLEEVRVFPNDARTSQKVTNLRAGVNFKPVVLTLNVYNLLQYNYTQVERNLEPIRSFALTGALTF